MGRSKPFNVKLREARQRAGYTNGDDAWAALKAVYTGTPSRSTFLRFESDPNAEFKADPAVFAIYCEHVLGVDPASISNRLARRADELRSRLLLRNSDADDSAVTPRYSERRAVAALA